MVGFGYRGLRILWRHSTEISSFDVELKEWCTTFRKDLSSPSPLVATPCRGRELDLLEK
jgi:hypothetical protein